MNPLLTGQLGSRPVLPLRDADRRREQPAGSGAWPARGVPASRSIPASACVEHFDPELASFRTIEAQIAAARWSGATIDGTVHFSDTKTLLLLYKKPPQRGTA